MDEKLFDCVLNHEKLDPNVRLTSKGLEMTTLEIAISRDNYGLAVKFLKAGCEMTIPNQKRLVGKNFAPLSKLITMKGFGYQDFFITDADHYDKEEWPAIKMELYLFQLWIKTVPKRRGTLMEMVTLKLRQQLTRDELMVMIGNRELDQIIRFFAHESFPWM